MGKGEVAELGPGGPKLGVDVLFDLGVARRTRHPGPHLALEHEVPPGALGDTQGLKPRTLRATGSKRLSGTDFVGKGSRDQVPSGFWRVLAGS